MTKVAIVTGGAHPIGIGFASARALRKVGYDQVIVTGFSEKEIAMTPKEDGISAALLDVTNEDSIAKLIGGLTRLDALVNCAGHATPHEFEIAQFARTLEVNLTGMMRMCNAAHPLLAKQGGAIVNIGSVYSTFGSKIAPGYAASKTGVVGLTRSLAVAWASEGIRCNAVAPGWVKTDMARVLWENPAEHDPIAARIPTGHWAEPQMLGDVVGFLCSHESRYVNGVLIPVDGGYIVAG